MGEEYIEFVTATGSVAGDAGSKVCFNERAMDDCAVRRIHQVRQYSIDK